VCEGVRVARATVCTHGADPGCGSRLAGLACAVHRTRCMNPSTWFERARLLLGAGALAVPLFFAGCIPQDAAQASAYEECQVAWGEEALCGGGPTACFSNPRPNGNAFDDGAGMCTRACVATSDCPTLAGASVVCELYDSGRLCTVKCLGDEDCPHGTGCEDLDRGNGETVRRCLP
jgi:hypothetical protein